MRRAILAVWTVLACAAALCQTPAAADKLTFEAVSIKPFVPPQDGLILFGRGGGPGTGDPGRINWNSATLRDLLMQAYSVKRYQINGPDWLDSSRWTVSAKVPEGATKEQVAVMYQNMLASRFGLKVHHEKKEFPAEELTVAKGGPKLKPTDVDPNAAPFDPSKGPPPEPPKLDKNGFPSLPGPGLIVLVSPGQNGSMMAHMVGRARTMAEIAEMLGNELNKPVVDKTGLTGKYDYNIEYKPDMSRMPKLPPGPGGPPPGSADQVEAPGSTMTSAVQEQLGLKLASAKAPLDLVVVDHIEKTPTED